MKFEDGLKKRKSRTCFQDLTYGRISSQPELKDTHCRKDWKYFAETTVHDGENNPYQHQFCYFFRERINP